jgi:hypothetical protein
MSLANAALILQAGGAISSMFGSYFGAKAQQSTLLTQAFISETNARIAELGAQSALLQGEKQVASLTMQAGKVKSAQRAAMAANGIDLGVGSAAEVSASTDIMKEIDKNQITVNAVNNAWGYRTQAVNMQNDALMKRATAGSISPGTAAFTSLLGGAAQVAGSWYSMKKTGMFDSPSTGSVGGSGGWESNSFNGVSNSTQTAGYSW